ncbi:hypothetical protein Sgleb_60130 [Streptomyces glebosus]|uniref:Trypsin-co-occurring domain-containing protein n=1 Tax=Streptomyces glebosus TaxID=249580 RepID=A0A640T6P8_9ACTN|nr:trypco2 family protein [Streptomyces glebosus]GFE17966.1 hypothetical protein Sgleb_60130 [Streptomyces glebosus]GHG46844.1 hypothetical protein GCM10010513_02870 [Streptomyces glebosus]
MTDSTSEASEGYGLPAVFEALRSDLAAAQQRLLNADQEAILNLKETEVELTFTVERTGKGKGGINLKVFGVGFEAGGEKGTNQSTVHRLKVTLEPSQALLGVAGEDADR